MSDQLSHPDGLLLAVLPALGGVGTAVQQAINGRVARTASADAYGAVAAGVVNFVVGFAALLVVFGADLALRGAPHHLPSKPWLYFGGACGVIFISAAAAVVRVVGVFVLGLGTIAGQLIASLFIDLFLPAADKAVTLPVVAGTVLALAAVVVAAVPNLRRELTCQVRRRRLGRDRPACAAAAAASPARRRPRAARPARRPAGTR